MLKIDIINSNRSNIVQYELYNPKYKNKLDLQICKNVSTYINTPILFSSDIDSLLEMANKTGYNIFDSNDSFYNDICSTFTSENGIDIPMNDRHSDIYNNINYYTLCQNNCTFMYYNSKIQKAKCECQVQTSEINTNNTNFITDNELVKNFFSIIKNSNFLVLNCCKLVFSLKGQINNIGSYIMAAIILFLIVLIIIYFIIDRNKIHYIILKIIFIKKGKDQKFSNSNKPKKSKKQNIFNDKNINKNNILTIKNSKVKDNIAAKKKKEIIIKGHKNGPPKHTIITKLANIKSSRRGLCNNINNKKRELTIDNSLKNLNKDIDSFNEKKIIIVLLKAHLLFHLRNYSK